MSERLSWQIDGRDWPHRDRSEFVDAGGLAWHVQRMGPAMGQAPALFMVHGTGASTHSWRALMPVLAERFSIIAADLPGHGFTSMPPTSQLTLTGMAKGLAALLHKLNIKPDMAVGHSAGAAILIRMCLDKTIAPKVLISLNGALLPFHGVAGQIFSPLAKLLVLNPLVPKFFSWRAEAPDAVSSLLEGTGSAIGEEGVELYRRLFRSPGHIAGALGMMANWDLAPFARDLRKLTTPLVLVTGGKDKAIAPEEALRVRERVPLANIQCLEDLGHLAHEEQPETLSNLIVTEAEKAGVLEKMSLPEGE